MSQPPDAALAAALERRRPSGQVTVLRGGVHGRPQRIQFDTVEQAAAFILANAPRAVPDDVQ